MAKINFQTFHEQTAANFQPCEPPSRAPDFASESGSRYWDTGDGVIRQSNHWGHGIRSCSWFFAGHDHRADCATGFAPYSSFGRKVGMDLMFADCFLMARGNLTVAGELLADREYRQRKAAAAKLVETGTSLRAIRTVSERLRNGRFRTVREEVSFTIAKITACFFVAADGRRFGRHTLSDLRAA